MAKPHEGPDDLWLGPVGVRRGEINGEPPVIWETLRKGPGNGGRIAIEAGDGAIGGSVHIGQRGRRRSSTVHRGCLPPGQAVSMTVNRHLASISRLHPTPSLLYGDPQDLGVPAHRPTTGIRSGIDPLTKAQAEGPTISLHNSPLSNAREPEVLLPGRIVLAAIPGAALPDAEQRGIEALHRTKVEDLFPTVGDLGENRHLVALSKQITLIDLGRHRAGDSPDLLLAEGGEIIVLVVDRKAHPMKTTVTGTHSTDLLPKTLLVRGVPDCPDHLEAR